MGADIFYAEIVPVCVELLFHIISLKTCLNFKKVIITACRYTKHQQHKNTVTL